MTLWHKSSTSTVSKKPASVRKNARKRSEERAQADENAVKFGRTKHQKSVDKANNERAKRDLDGKKS